MYRECLSSDRTVIAQSSSKPVVNCEKKYGNVTKMERLAFTSHLGDPRYRAFKDSIFESENTDKDAFLHSNANETVPVKIREIRVYIIMLETLMLSSAMRTFFRIQGNISLGIERDLCGQITARYSKKTEEGGKVQHLFVFHSVNAFMSEVAMCLP